MQKIFAIVALSVSLVYAQQPTWSQCGGIGWGGGTTCAQGNTCVKLNDWYYQCQPGSAPTTQPPVTTTTQPPVTTQPSTSAPPATTSAPSSNNTLPSTFRWRSTGVLIGPKNDGRGVAGIKDPTVIQQNGVYHIFASTASQANGYNLVYTNFTDWSQAPNAPFFYLDRAPLGTGYRAAPEVFYFAPQKLWYLVYQNGNAAYSTNPNLSNPAGWTAPKTFYSEQPKIIKDNIGNGYWVDMWVVCDSAKCHLFSSDDNGHLYRSETSLSNFPNGFNDPVIVLQDSNIYRLWEAACIYKVKGTNDYLLIVEAIGTDSRRWFRSWTSTSIAGPWKNHANEESTPFARANNVEFPSGAWTKDISHGEMVRRGSLDQTLEIDPCNLEFLYQGQDPNASGDYNNLPWRLALITQTNKPSWC
ncbi:glycosyl hydrolase family 62 protein [Coprinopsis sp. MPI-PUGE-AT-0042]|nr:glycosyl hydrolase family 62 protein [Coprinopsis sp. MPI-PUGE-AT-0042]